MMGVRAIDAKHAAPPKTASRREICGLERISESFAESDLMMYILFCASYRIALILVVAVQDKSDNERLNPAA
jgi:hypothetical protein